MNAYPTGASTIRAVKETSTEPFSRRAFIRTAGGTLLSSTLLGAACDREPNQVKTLEETRFVERFDHRGDGWGPNWTNVRYESKWETGPAGGFLYGDPVVEKAIQEGKELPLYMAQPVVFTKYHADDVTVRATLRIDGQASSGVIARASWDEAYGLLVEDERLVLCRYDVLDRTVLASAPLPAQAEFSLTLAVEGAALRGAARAGDDSEAGQVSVDAVDPSPLSGGFVGVVLNPRSPRTSSGLTISRFEARGRFTSPQNRIAYRFAGAVVPAGADRYKARLTARTVLPARVGFEVSRSADFSGSMRIEPRDPTGDLGSVHVWAEDLEGDSVYFWRPFAPGTTAEVRGPVASFRTPPPPDGAVRFVYGCCTSGRVTSYSSFARAAAFDPHFYLHSGDWGYADLTALARRSDHFHARWMRLLRDRDVGKLLDRSPLLFWQDDHDYQADNGWAATVQQYAVDAFDELHANPSDDYFDFRWGDLHVWCLDCRLHATDPEAPDGPAKSRLGLEQKRWLLEGLEKSDAAVQVIASPMVFRNKPDDDPGWHNVYAYERDQLLAAFAKLDATVLILSGDSHGQRLIHHFEFGDLFEVNSSGTDFPGGNQGNNDPEHTLVNLPDSGFAVVELDSSGPDRRITARVIGTEDGRVLFEKALPVRPGG